MKEYLITVNGKTYEVQVEERNPASPQIIPIPNATKVPKAVPMPSPTEKKPEIKPLSTGKAGKTAINCPMPGTILKINVNAGDAIKKGDVLCVLEAMKMENDIQAPEDGVVASVNTSKGANVNSGDLLFTID